MHFPTTLLALLATITTLSLAAPVASPFPLPSPLEEPDQSCHAETQYPSEDYCNAACGKDSYTGTCSQVSGGLWNCYCPQGGPAGDGVQS